MNYNTFLTLPNILSLSRLAGVPLLFVLVFSGAESLFLAFYILIGATDYLDGFFARRQNKVSSVGSQLDSVADIAYYASTAFFFFYLFPEYVIPNYPLMALLTVIVIASITLSLKKNEKAVFLHTHFNRLNAVLVVAVMPLSFLFDTTRLIGLLLVLFCIAFLEVCLIFWYFGSADPDTRSFFTFKSQNKE